ncbi:hypothetical protein VDQ16_11770 [Xanthomonas campestris pv. campestris]|nr:MULTISPECIES: hypothetical protein [Xanthomonas]MEB1260786.1 hypothetical protein [Xanthomonas campestris pv. campestris]MEB1323240.1 hypothetical protein [Xanthomonas campestris pv. campestris]MEB1356639.1 hypothetical protein [Xanthomonas campestris pv. campestris]MEB1422723.1 hypothetical protein [Xanthomonas campestris pv. campestris]MEB1447464.1 hypothetical protein [Xanthomonas campestris pv. campestris]
MKDKKNTEETKSYYAFLGAALLGIFFFAAIGAAGLIDLIK